MNTLSEVRALSRSAYDFIVNFNIDTMKDGRYELENGAYANVCSYETKDKDEAVLEAHRDFIDVQYLVMGEELIITQDTSVMHKNNCIKKYDKAADAELYEIGDNFVTHYLNSGDLIILYPCDGHAPGIACDTKQVVKKIIVKIPCTKK